MFRFDYSIYLLARSSTAYDFSTDPPTLDPQMWWYETHKRIGDFIAQLLPTRRYRLHGERSDRLMLALGHPPHSMVTTIHSYLKNPEFRGFRPKPESLDGPLP
jgi:hypothetical protein